MAYRPALEYAQDSFSYLWNAEHLAPDVIRPVGYSFLLKALSLTGHLTVVPVVQHLFGLLMGVMLYVLMLGLGARPWLAALGAAPVLLDGYQIYLEQFVMAEAFFEILVVAALVLLLARRRPGVMACAAAGVLLGAAAVTRTVGLILLVPVLAYLVVLRVGVRRLLAVAGGAGVVLLAYAGWFHRVNGQFALGAYEGYFLAARVQPFADCRDLDLPALERALCDTRPPAERPGSDWYVWNPESPLRRPEGPRGRERNRIAGEFARRIIRHQPGDYLRTVMGDVLHYFAPGRWTGPKDNPVRAWQFRTSFRPSPWHPEYPPADPYVWNWTWPDADVQDGTVLAAHGFGLEPVAPHLDRPLARLLRGYQRVGYTPGPVLALAVAAALFGALRRSEPEQRHLRWSSVLLATCGMVVLVVPAATATFDYRYMFPSLVLLPPAGVLGVTLIQQSMLARPREQVGAAPSES